MAERLTLFSCQTEYGTTWPCDAILAALVFGYQIGIHGDAKNSQRQWLVYCGASRIFASTGLDWPQKRRQTAVPLGWAGLGWAGLERERDKTLTKDTVTSAGGVILWRRLRGALHFHRKTMHQTRNTMQITTMATGL